MRSGRPVIGAEQIFDVELDRNARPLPADLSLDGLSNSVLWADDRGTSDRINQRGRTVGDDVVGVDLVTQIKPEARAEVVMACEEETSSEDRAEPRVCLFKRAWDEFLTSYISTRTTYSHPQQPSFEVSVDFGRQVLQIR